jgi:hypothetical protein
MELRRIDMNKLITSIALVSSFAVAQINMYHASIEVAPAKVNGKNWDISGGAPDIILRLDGKTVAFNSDCQDTYKCTTNTFSTNKKILYIEIYDRDIAVNDLIGKGECRVDSPCQIGQAIVKIEKVTASLRVLADARLSALELQEALEVKIKLMFEDIIDERVMPTEKGLKVLMDVITTLRVYGKDINKEAKNNLINLVKQLNLTGFQNKALLKKLDDIARSSHVVPA